jgi:hypothetical protein
MKGMYKILLTTLLISLVISCDLQPEIKDGLSARNYPTNEQEFLSTIGVAYRGLIGYYDNERYFGLISPSTDELVAPTRAATGLITDAGYNLPPIPGLLSALIY